MIEDRLIALQVAKSRGEITADEYKDEVILAQDETISTYRQILSNLIETDFAEAEDDAEVVDKYAMAGISVSDLMDMGLNEIAELFEDYGY